MEKPNSSPAEPALLSLLQQRQPREPLPPSSPAAPNDRPAVVLAPLVLPHWDAPLSHCCLLFIQRAAHLRHHAGQVGFPGGRVEEDDASLWHAGLREAQEEIGLESPRVRLIAPLPPASVPSGFYLHPFFVATDQSGFQPDLNEVESIHLVPLRDLLSCPVRVDYRHWRGQDWRVVSFDLESLCVWGATGRIVEHLLSHFFDWRAPA